MKQCDCQGVNTRVQLTIQVIRKCNLTSHPDTVTMQCSYCRSEVNFGNKQTMYK